MTHDRRDSIRVHSTLATYELDRCSHAIANIWREDVTCSLSSTMKQRLTYVVKNPEDFSPEQIEVKDDRFTLKNVHAAKEHRITLGLDELPEEVPDTHPTTSIYPNKFPRSATCFSNGTNFTFVGPMQSPTQQHHPLHHVSHPVYTCSSHRCRQQLRTHYANNYTRTLIRI
jgi:hypothetical protein